MQDGYRYALKIAYDGTHYGGWQIQHNAPSLQAALQQALLTFFQTPILVYGSGRTDAGVHALGQVAHICLDTPPDLNKLLASLNCLLPLDIRVMAIVPVPSDFHARYSAQAKTYYYCLHLDPVADPLKLYYSYHHPYPLNQQWMKQGASHFVGTHDFTSFSHQAHQGAAAINPVRSISKVEIVAQEGGIRLEFEGNGFLYKMVRNMVGTLIEVGTGRMRPDEIPLILAERDRRSAPKTAPAHGLFLAHVRYEQELWSASESELRQRMF